MTRKAHLEPYLPSEELKARYLSTIDKVERRRKAFTRVSLPEVDN